MLSIIGSGGTLGAASSWTLWSQSGLSYHTFSNLTRYAFSNGTSGDLTVPTGSYTDYTSTNVWGDPSSSGPSWASWLATIVDPAATSAVTYNYPAGSGRAIKPGETFYVLETYETNDGSQTWTPDGGDSFVVRSRFAKPVVTLWETVQ